MRHADHNDGYALRPCGPADGPARGWLMRGDRKIGPEISGGVLAAVFILGDGDHLVFTEEGCAFEESAYIAWLRADGRLGAQAQILRPYATGTLRNFQVFGDRGVEFSFFSDDRWRVWAAEAGGWRRLWGRMTGRARLRLEPATRGAI